MTMFGLGVPNGGDFADPGRLAALAHAAEAAGWDGFFLWDHVIRRRPWQPMVDPWVTLAAVAVATDHLVLGPMVTPLARRRVSVVARQSVTLDRLAGGVHAVRRERRPEASGAAAGRIPRGAAVAVVR
jgi:alkanesulfonate monooxygenase SsuD/methylene tetrahydromethanopterin reductase-like flavin-dependent oxidoreductase (luciferase family)